jgi:hypothetical protein
MAHPDCLTEHVCAVPSGKSCVEPGCDAPAGTKWGPYWCPPHDQERLARVSDQLHGVQASFISKKIAVAPKKAHSPAAQKVLSSLPSSPMDFLSPEDRATLQADLCHMAALRRRAETESASIPMY